MKTSSTSILHTQCFQASRLKVLFVLTAILQTSSLVTGFTPSSTAIRSLRSHQVSLFSSHENHDVGSENPVLSPIYDDDHEAFSRRSIASIQRYSRLPVWPAWNGALIFILSRFAAVFKYRGDGIAWIEDLIGGRVCPNFFDGRTTSPFLLLVHHSHSFFQYDILRHFQSNFILPEGFPSHPHRGFITLTYCLKGGMVHRDSTGVKQVYGAENRHRDDDKGQTLAQWLIAGAGMLHEEMWDINHDEDGIWSKQELFQFWINLPKERKMDSPQIHLLTTSTDRDRKEARGALSAPIVRSPCGAQDTLILAGEYMGQHSEVPTQSPMTILHVRINIDSTLEKENAQNKWSMDLPKSYKTVILYMRQGSATVEGVNIPAHSTATLKSTGCKLIVEGNESTGADFLLLAGEPLVDPVEMGGSMVMDSREGIDLAYKDYEMGKMGVPWDYSLDDSKWREHVEKFPSKYKK